MDTSPPDPTTGGLSAASASPRAAPSRAATRVGAGVSAAGGLGALTGFLLPWFVAMAVVQTGCRVQTLQIEAYNLYGVAIAVGAAGLTAAALAIVVALCALGIIVISFISLGRPVLFNIRVLLALSLVGLGALGLLAAMALSGQVRDSDIVRSILIQGFGSGYWVTSGGLALALIGGAALHAAARPLRQRAPIGEIALASLGIAGLLSSAVASVVGQPAPYPSLYCVQQGNTPSSGDRAVYFTSADGIYALDAASGRVLWRCRNPLGGVVTDSAPTLANGVLYVASRDGYVFAMRADDATVLWRADVGGHGDTTRAAHVAPIIADGLVYGVNGAGQVYALRASDGASAWTGIWAAVRWTMPTLLQADGRLFYFTISGPYPQQLIALDERTGLSQWRSTGIGVSPAYPTVGISMRVDDGIVYDEEISTDRGERYLTARSASDGAILWQYKLLSPNGLSSAFTIVDGIVYLQQFQGISQRVVALRASDGKLLWGAPTLPVVSSPTSQARLAAGSGGAYLAMSTVPGGHLDTIYGLDDQQGAVLWRRDLAYSSAASASTNSGQPELAVAGDSVCLLDSSGAVTALDAHTGSSRWQFNSGPTPATWAPTPGALTVGDTPASSLTTGLLYVATSKLYAINPVDGVVRWRFTPGTPVTPYVQAYGYNSPIISPPTFAP